MLKCFKKFFGAAFTAMLFMAMPCGAQQPSAPATSEGDFVIHNFQFHSGESLPELRLHYTTLGKPEKDAAGHTTPISPATVCQRPFWSGSASRSIALLHRSS